MLEAPWYGSVFPTARIGPYKNSETEIELTARGFRLATSVGGTLTGRGGDIIVIDDPLKPDDDPSEIRRTVANQWFTNTLLSRLDDKRTGAIVIVMQRVHMDDPGFVLSTSDEWEVLDLPAIAEADEDIPISATKTDADIDLSDRGGILMISRVIAPRRTRSSSLPQGRRGALARARTDLGGDAGVF